MFGKRVTIINKTGLHARPASVFVAAAGKFASDITIHKLDEDGNEVKRGPAKSIVYLMAMQLKKGTLIEIAAEGADEKEAVDTLCALVEGGFDDL